AVADCQRAPEIGDAATEGVAIRDGQAVEHYVRYVGKVEDSIIAAGVAAHGQTGGAWALDLNTAVQDRQHAVEVDRARDAEIDHVDAGLTVGSGDRVAQTGHCRIDVHRVGQSI